MRMIGIKTSQLRKKLKEQNLDIKEIFKKAFFLRLKTENL